MMRTPQGELVILDFGLMTEVTEEQKYGMIEAIAHLIHRDYDRYAAQFWRNSAYFGAISRNSRNSLTAHPHSQHRRRFHLPRLHSEGHRHRAAHPRARPRLRRCLRRGGAKSINFQELAADLAEITFEFPFRIPPYFALVIRIDLSAEGIASSATRR